MNVFEDLIVELKEENLLERTVIEVEGQKNAKTGDVNASDFPATSYDLPEPAVRKNGSAAPPSVQPETSEPAIETSEAEILESQPETEAPAAEAATVLSNPESPLKKPRNGNEFYKKRAVGEVSNLQMVEHVLTGVEREYMKIVPSGFDDFRVKKALHAFLNVNESENSEQHAESEFTLMNETEAWCTALAERDKNVPVSSLRQYCENSRPALSSQALLALARFYRNLPYSEGVRAKFDFVITRLFSRPTEHEKRVCLFTRDETFVHVSTLYREWSSIALYSAEDDESKVLLTALSFEDLAIEAENASSFDLLIESDYFGRLKLFKESISELFYAPNVTAAAIECNIRIGNAYVNLIARERQKLDDESIQSKYGDLNDQAVSDAAARTLALVAILREGPAVVRPVEAPVEDKPPIIAERPAQRPAPVQRPEPEPQIAVQRPAVVEKFLENVRSVNKWFLAGALALILASVGLSIWSNYFIDDEVPTVGVSSISVENNILKDHVKSARISQTTFYALLQPSWNQLPKEKRVEYLQMVYRFAVENGCTQVSLTNTQGKAAGYASATRTEVVMP